MARTKRKLKSTIEFDVSYFDDYKLTKEEVSNFNRRLKNYISDIAELIATSKDNYEYLNPTRLKVKTEVK